MDKPFRAANGFIWRLWTDSVFNSLTKMTNRLFYIVPFFFCEIVTSIVEFEGPPSWSLDASETGESTKYQWVGVVGGGRKIFSAPSPPRY